MFQFENRRIRNALNQKFILVEENFYKYTTQQLQDFLIVALDYHKFYTSNMYLRRNRYYNFMDKDCVYGSVGNGYMDFCNKKDSLLSEIKFVVLHELGHLNQLIIGDLKWNSGTEAYYKGNKIDHETLYRVSDIDYQKLPWEVDATRFAINSFLMPPISLIQNEHIKRGISYAMTGMG